MRAALPYDSLAALRNALIAEYPHLGQIDQVAENDWKPAKIRGMGKGNLASAITDFYLTNPIARASSVMAELSANAADRKTNIAAE